MKNQIIKSALVATTLLAVPAAAHAQDEGPYIDGYIGVANKMRDRGVQYDQDDPVLFANITVSTDGGFYGGVKTLALPDGDIFEHNFEFFAGFSRETDSGYIYDLSVDLDTYYGDNLISDFAGTPEFALVDGVYDGNYSFPQVNASVARDFGLAYIRGGLSYAPKGRWSNIFGESVYASLDVEVPVPTLPDITLIGHIGYDHLTTRRDIDPKQHDRFDWGIGFSAFISDFEVSAFYERAYDARANRALPDMGIGGDQNGSLNLALRFYF